METGCQHPIFSTVYNDAYFLIIFRRISPTVASTDQVLSSLAI